MPQQLSRSIKEILQPYLQGGFIIHVILMVMEFETIKDKIGPMDVNPTVTREYVGKIERDIRLIKERCRCVVKILTFRYLHKQIVISMVYFVTMFVNVMLVMGSISQVSSPCEIVTQWKIDFI